ncbi:hypothetical protein GCE86_23755 [Micromonospora terminaliae]|uniref:Uncharacterized protein n=1 Tax=Micromonospora terminaliae TaxID=1914461 RepID=A0AAJ2ZKF8_9ACTN|nr:hypothetical protein [Micromonospora terminaliae]NES31406.1 hypothetical protein [Micromonospora terminaliae]QGL49775.1 hypothetical protein GCE86_23755 [Micromonospora terminaliae]
MSTQVPRLFAGLVDDAAVFPPGSAALPDAVAAHHRHRAGWYADLVGPLLLPASTLPDLPGLLAPEATLAVGVIGDVPVGRLEAALAEADARLVVRQVEAPVAKRGEDPQPGLADLLKLAERLGGTTVYAEVPLTFGLLGALDALAEARAGGLPVAAKFRTGGLAAELFPTPVELAAVICACRDRELPFKLTAGLHQAIRHRDPETGFTHHGFVNVLAATLAATGGAEVDGVAELLAATDPLRVVEPARSQREAERPLWVGYGSCSISEPLTDLIRLGLVNGGFEE